VVLYNNVTFKILGDLSLTFLLAFPLALVSDERILIIIESIIGKDECPILAATPSQTPAQCTCICCSDSKMGERTSLVPWSGWPYGEEQKNQRYKLKCCSLREFGYVLPFPMPEEFISEVGIKMASSPAL
jgi:hypothetical protein